MVCALSGREKGVKKKIRVSHSVPLGIFYIPKLCFLFVMLTSLATVAAVPKRSISENYLKKKKLVY